MDKDIMPMAPQEHNVGKFKADMSRLRGMFSDFDKMNSYLIFQYLVPDKNIRIWKVFMMYATNENTAITFDENTMSQQHPEADNYLKNVTSIGVRRYNETCLSATFEEKNGWITDSSATDQPKGEAFASTIGPKEGASLFYSTIKFPRLLPNFVGNEQFMPMTGTIKGFIEEYIKQPAKITNYLNCQKEDIPVGYNNASFCFFPFGIDGISGAKEVCMTFSHLNYGDYKIFEGNARRYDGTGNKEWRLGQEGDRYGNISFNYNVTVPEGKFIFTNDIMCSKQMTTKWKVPAEKVKLVKHPREIPAEHGGGYMCNGSPWPGEGETIDNPSNLPTGHKYFLKGTEGSLPTCWTFDGFQERDGHYSITASNGRLLKYIYDGGCWHFFTSLPKAIEIKNTLKDVTTNNKELHDYLLKNKGHHTGKLIHYSGIVDISKDYWLNSKNLYFASWTSKEKSDKPQDQTFYLALFDFADGNTIRKPDGSSSTPIVAHFEKGKIVKLSAPWKDYKTEWKPEGTYSEYRFDKLAKYNNFKTNHRVLWGWLERHGRIAGSQSKFISPCTQIKPDGTLPDGVIGPPLPPAVKPPSGNNDGYDPNKPGQGGNGLGDNGPIRYEDISVCYAGLDNLTMLTNNKLNGLYYYYLEGSLYNAGGSDNTTILGTTGAICNVAYAPFLNLNASNLCRAEFDTKRYGKIEGIEAENLQPKVFRIKADFSPKPMKIAQWPVYPSVNINTSVGTPWKYYHESRILDYPYRQVAFISNVFDAYDVIPHLFSETNKGNNVELNICCPVTPGGNFYAWVEGYKGDSSGFNERQFSNASMDIPNTSSAYSNYMSTQKAQASTSVFSSFGSSLISSAPGVVATASQSSSELIKWANMGWKGMGSATSIMAGAMAFPLGIAASTAMAAGATAVMQNMALQKDLRTTPKSLISMGGDINARLGCDGKATVVACDYEITDQYKELIARYFHMYGTKQNRILDIASNINSRHYFNYIKTVGCNISANGVPKRYVAAIKSIFDKGATFWHVDNSGVNVGEYCVYDNVEV